MGMAVSIKNGHSGKGRMEVGIDVHRLEVDPGRLLGPASIGGPVAVELEILRGSDISNRAVLDLWRACIVEDRCGRRQRRQYGRSNGLRDAG